MKLTTFILMIALAQVSAKGLAQKITLNANNMPIEKVLQTITQQSGYEFLYDKKDFKDQNFTLKFTNVSIEDAIKQVIKGLPITYKIVKNNVVLTHKETSLLDQVGEVFKRSIQFDEKVSGIVADSLDRIIIGASVTLKGAKLYSTQTDNNGRFVFASVPEGTYELNITYIGYQKLAGRLEIRKGMGQLRLVLRQATSKLDVVQIIAYGTDTRRFSVGSVSTVSAVDIEKQPLVNPLLALQGLVPGLAINATNGAPGAAVQVQIRGQNTLRSNLKLNATYNQPLFIIDGVPFAPQNNNINLLQSLAVTQYPSPYGGISPFNSINPQDIESVSILKDADATSIYGSQGANGVILITTKKGKPGMTKFSASVNTGFTNATRQIQMLNTQQYLQLRREALNNDGIILPTTYSGNYADLLLFDQNKYTDWSQQFYGKTAHNTDAHVSISGGSQNSTFIISGGYTHSDFNFPGDFAENRLTLHTGFHQSALNNKLTIDFGSDYSYYHNNDSGQPSAGAALSLSPNFPDMLDASGNLIWNYKGFDFTGYQQYSYLKQTNDLGTYNLNNTLRLNYQVLAGLSISANLGYSRLTTNEHAQTPLSSFSPANTFLKSSAAFANNSFQAINIEPAINYKKTIGKGELTALLGGTYKKNLTSSENIFGNDYPTDALLASITGATTVFGSSTEAAYKYVGVYGRVGYIYDSKYIINLTGRRDGSSNFGPGHQFGNFGSVGLGWIISQEDYFKKALSFISYAKLSGNYGTNGSDGVAPYQYQAYWTSNTSIAPFQGVRPYNIANLYNPDYSWSTKKSLNLAFDLGFLNDRFLLNATWYHNRTGNQLVGAALPIQTGFNSVTENLPATVQDKGWEFTLTSNNIKGKSFSWTTNFNIAFNRNKLIAFPGLANSPYASIYTIGRSTNTVNGFVYKDVNPTTGLFEFYNAQGDVTSTLKYGVLSAGGDQQPIVDLQPKFLGGLGNTFNYKGISLSAFFQFAKQTGPNYLLSVYSSTAPGTQNNVPVEVLNHWTKIGDQSPLQKASSSSFGSQAGTTASYFAGSSGVYGDASYIRLKTLSLSYTLPTAFLQNAGVKICRIYVNAQNLLTITGYKVGDPETPGVLSAIPLQRVLAFGLSFNF